MQPPTHSMSDDDRDCELEALEAHSSSTSLPNNTSDIPHLLSSEPLNTTSSSPIQVRMQHLLSRAPPKLQAAFVWLYGANATPLEEPRSWLRIRCKKRVVQVENVWMRWTRRLTSPILLAILIAGYIIGCATFPLYLELLNV